MEQAISSTTSKYVRDFESLFVPIKADQLRNKARLGELRHCQFRSLCWKYFLHCLPEQHDQWLKSCLESRKQYDDIRAKYSPSKQLSSQQPLSTSPSNLEKATNNVDTNTNYAQDEKDTSSSPNPPLSISSNAVNLESSSKRKELEEERQYIEAANQCDHKNVFRTIERDVVRTFPDMEFFRQTEMQAILENVLFNFANENPHLSYKQGMHELLATLLYVLHTDSQNCLINYQGGYANETIATLLDFKYLEHDVFHIFSALMKSIETWYQNDEVLILPPNATTTPALSKKKDNNGFTVNRSSNRQQVGSVLGNKLKMISETIVRSYDLELYNHLEALQIAPQIYGIRWMRLLFGREFEFLDLLTVWDAIICDHVSMSLIDYIFASMLVTIREELVNGDYTDCLNNLMRHQFKDVQYVIKLALHLRDPHNNPRPKPLHYRTQKHFSQTVQPSKHSSVTSLTSKLSQQYISTRQQIQHQAKGSRNYLPSQSVGTNIATRDSSSLRRNPPKVSSPSMNTDNRDSRNVFSMTSKTKSSHDKKGQDYSFNSITSTDSSGIKFLNPTSRFPEQLSGSSSKKFLPNINKFVSSIGQNIQDKTNQSPSASTSRVRNQQWSSSQEISSTGKQLYNSRRSTIDPVLLTVSPIKEYEMREMQSTSSSSSVQKRQSTKFPTGTSLTRDPLNMSTESYDDLHTIVDYCWRLLSEQIDSLQRCLPKEKSLHSEDEIFVALAQLKKVRDVLKGSLRLEDELEPLPGGSKT